MLAPRKKLWSTPLEAVEAIHKVVKLSDSDSVVDIGCGDGQVLIHWATLVSKSDVTPKFIGIDVDAERMQRFRTRWDELVAKEHIRADIRVEFYKMNALEQMDLWKHATVVFVYLIPRGLRKLLPLLPNNIMLISYMNPVSDLPLLETKHIEVAHQPGSAWPLYFYRVN